MEGSNSPGFRTKHSLFGAWEFRFLVFSLSFFFKDAFLVHWYIKLRNFPDAKTVCRIKYLILLAPGKNFFFVSKPFLFKLSEQETNNKSKALILNSF